MTEPSRVAVFKDGSTKEFEELEVGEVFKILEPNGETFSDPYTNKVIWYKLTNCWNNGCIMVDVVDE